MTHFTPSRPFRQVLRTIELHMRVPAIAVVVMVLTGVMTGYMVRKMDEPPPPEPHVCTGILGAECTQDTRGNCLCFLQERRRCGGGTYFAESTPVCR